MIDLYMDYYDFDTEVRIVQAHSHISLPEAKRIVKIVRAIRGKLPEPDKPSTRSEVMISQGLKTLGNYSKEDFEHICLDVLASKIGNPRETSNKTNLLKEALNGAYPDVQIGEIAAAIQEVSICET